MSSQEPQLACVMDKDIHRRRPESSRFLVGTTFRTLSAVAMRQSQMLDHRVVPLNKLLRERARLERADAIPQNPVHVHVTPIFRARKRLSGLIPSGYAASRKGTMIPRHRHGGAAHFRCARTHD